MCSSDLCVATPRACRRSWATPEWWRRSTPMRGWRVSSRCASVARNWSLPVAAGVDWICVSPKAGATLAQTSGHELKLVYPQVGAEPGRFERLDFRHFLLQPMDGPDVLGNTKAAVDYCLAHPRWRLSLQTHKMIGVK